MSPKFRWLVRSSGHIFGPFDQSEIDKRLRAREFVVFDEVSRPQMRWVYIRDEAAFARVVEELRVTSIHGGNIDDLGTKTIPVGEETVTNTEPVTLGFGDFTEKISHTHSGVQEIVYEDVDESLDVVESSTPNVEQQTSGYAMAGGGRVQNRVQKSTNLLWIITGLVVVLALLFVGYKELILKPKAQVTSVNNYISTAIRQLSVGDNVQALENFKEAKNEDPQNPDINLYLGVLLIQIEGQTVLGKRYLGSILDGRYSKQAHVGIGLADLIEGNLDDAKRNFGRALEQDPTYQTAQIDLGVVEMEKRDFSRAMIHFMDAIKNGSRDGGAYILYAEAAIQRWRQDKNNLELLHTALGVLENYLHTATDYHQEALLVYTYMKYLLDQGKVVEKLVSDFVDIDPLQTDMHRHNLFVDRRHFQWSALSGRCQQISDYVNNSSEGMAMNALCLFKGGQTVRARDQIEDALMRDPKSIPTQAINAHILFEMGQTERASVALARATLNSDTRYKMPKILQARYCEQIGNDKCADEAWMSIQKRDPTSIQSFAGLSNMHIRNQNAIKAQQSLVHGLTLAPQYRPLLKSQQQARDLGLIGEGAKESL